VKYNCLVGNIGLARPPIGVSSRSIYELYPLLAGYTSKCKIKKTSKALPQSIPSTVLSAKKKTGARKSEKGNRRSCMVERLSISKAPVI
jgi:hypothetical protein